MNDKLLELKEIKMTKGQGDCLCKLSFQKNGGASTNVDIGVKGINHLKSDKTNMANFNIIALRCFPNDKFKDACDDIKLKSLNDLKKINTELRKKLGVNYKKLKDAEGADK